MFGALLAGGAALGALSGAFGKKPKGIAPLEQAKQRGSFKSGTGTSTADGFTYNALPGQVQAVNTSGNQLNQLLSGGLAIDPNRQAKYQQAFYDSRAPQLAREQASTRNRANNARASSGASGSLAAILGQQALQTGQQNQLSQLQNQSVLGGEALANQALQQDAMRANIYNQQLQQYLGNQINAQASNQNAFNSQAGLDMNFANQRNGAALGTFNANKARDSFSRLGSIMNGAIGGGIAGMNAAKLFGGSSGVGSSAPLSMSNNPANNATYQQGFAPFDPTAKWDK